MTTDGPDRPYRPIDCALYSQLELWCMHRELLRLEWRDEGGLTHLETLVPRDLETRPAGEGEFLLARDGKGRERALRLDRLVRLIPAGTR